MTLGKMIKHASCHSSTAKFVFCRNKATGHHTWKDWNRNLSFLTDTLVCEIYMVTEREVESCKCIPFFLYNWRYYFAEVHVSITRMRCKVTLKESYRMHN